MFPDRLKRIAYEQWGERVSAIIGYHQWYDHQVRCAGTAVEFAKTASQTPSQAHDPAVAPSTRAEDQARMAPDGTCQVPPCWR
jgi:hypothetical protein